MSILTRTAPHLVEEWKTVKFKLGLPKLVSGSGDGILKNDGLNYTDWEYRVTRLIKTTCGRKGYLDDSKAHIINPDGDEVMALIVELSVPVDIARKISGCALARQAFLKVQSMFFFPRRSAHLSAWKNLSDIKFINGSDLPEYLKRVESKIEELDQAGFPWLKDSVKGIYYQLGLSASFTNASNTLNGRLRATPDVPIGAKQVKEIIRSTNDDLARDGTLTATFIEDNSGAAGRPEMTFNVYGQHWQRRGMAGRGVY